RRRGAGRATATRAQRARTRRCTCATSECESSLASFQPRSAAESWRWPPCRQDTASLACAPERFVGCGTPMKKLGVFAPSPVNMKRGRVARPRVCRRLLAGVVVLQVRTDGSLVGDLLRASVELQDVHAGAVAVDNVDVAAIVDFDVV